MPLEKLVSYVFRQFVVPTSATNLPNIFKLKTGPNCVWSYQPNRVKHRRDKTQDGSRGESTPLLTTNVFFTWSHLRPKTCHDCSAPLHISLMGEDEVSQSSGFISEVISSALLTKLVKINPPNFSKETKLRLILIAWVKFSNKAN